MANEAYVPLNLNMTTATIPADPNQTGGGWSVINPYGAGWAGQGVKAIRPIQNNFPTQENTTFSVAISPTGGAAVTGTVVLWQWVPTGPTDGFWGKTLPGAEVSFAGPTVLRGMLDVAQPVLIALKSISAGNLDTYVCTEGAAVS